MEDYSLADCKTQEFIVYRYMRYVMGICLMILGKLFSLHH